MLHQNSYQAKQVGPHAFEPKGPNAPKWYHVDGSGMVVGRLATVLARVITGKHKPTFSRHADTGDFVVVTNADQLVFTRNKWENKTYFKHTGWVGNSQLKVAGEMDRAEVLRKAVWGMTSRTALARRQLRKLKIYRSGEHPHAANKPGTLPAGVTRNTILQTRKK